MPIRRNCDPIYVQKIWDAIRQLKVADSQKIAKFVQTTTLCTPAQAELYVKLAAKDKLIVPSRKNDTSHTYKICQQELPELDGKDWYCFECHRAGDVTSCSNCFRVFHQNCSIGGRRKFESQKLTNNYPIPISPNIEKAIETSEMGQSVTIICDDSDDVIIETSNPDNVASVSGNADRGGTTTDEFVDKRLITYDETLCSVCNINRIDYSCGLDKSELNYMLKFALYRIRAWLPNRIIQKMAQDEKPEWLTDKELTWRANQLFFDHMDMSVIEVNLNTETYNLFSEFLADVYTIHHNVAIFHGVESQEYGAAEFVVRDAVHDITEMKNCVDCYKHSNEKLHPRWFCLPCRNPHQLVWAKQKGYPYWPAKVIKETDTHSDVRFFGGKYERALLQKIYIKPIEYTMESLQIKNTAGLNKAVEELKYHQLLLENPNELEKVLSTSKPRKEILSKPRNSLVINSTPSSNVSTPKKKKTISSSSSSSTTKNAEKRKRGRPSKDKTTKSSSKTKNFVPNGASIEKDTETQVKAAVKRRSVQTGPEKKKKLTEEHTNVSEAVSGNVIDISDGDDDYMEYSFRENSQESFSLEDTFQQVTSSTENFGKQESRTEGGMLPLDQPYSDSVERMRRKLENIANKKDIIKCAMDCMQLEIDKITNDNNEHLKRLFESHNQQISETKKKQWCYNCEQDAIYHCCWNTAYCSQTCQQQHWQAEHKKVCRRKRS